MNRPLSQTLIAPVIGLFAALLALIWLDFPAIVIINLALLWIVVFSIAYLYIFRPKKHRH